MDDGRLPVLIVVSDGRGETCRQVVEAALVQFEGQDFELAVRSEIRTPEQVSAVVHEAADRDATIFYTLVTQEARWALSGMAERMLVPTVDILGPSFSALYDLFQRAPTGKPGLFYASDRERFDRQSAIDYTLKHDDGRRADELHLADVVLVGVSRAAKSTTCFYLAFQGIRAANVPLVFGTPVLPQLAELDPSRVIALSVNVSRLLTVRQARSVNIGGRHIDYYTSKREVANEVIHAANLVKKHGWRSIEASYLAVEEIAREVMKSLPPRVRQRREQAKRPGS
ncbi:MAG: pyruvate, phosphate dikinase/phosphoenolpyruvate synthase regulator [Candidatus Krumholzibacteriota bacterium]